MLGIVTLKSRQIFKKVKLRLMSQLHSFFRDKIDFVQSNTFFLRLEEYFSHFWCCVLILQLQTQGFQLNVLWMVSVFPSLSFCVDVFTCVCRCIACMCTCEGQRLTSDVF